MDNRVELLEQDGLAKYNDAMQSPDTASFRKHIRDSIAAYEKATSLARCGNRGQLYRCQAMVGYLRYWVADGARAKHVRLDQTWRNAKRALRFFENTENGLEFARTYNQLSNSIIALTQYKLRARIKAARMKEVVDLGRRAIKLQAIRPSSRKELTGVLVKTACFLDMFADYIVGVSHQKECDQEALRYWKKALRVDRETALMEVSESPGFFRILSEEEGMTICQEALALARKTGHNFRVGWLLTQISHRLYWKARAAEPHSNPSRIADESLRFAEEAADRFERINFTAPDEGVLWVHSPYAEHFLEISRFEKDLERRRRILEKSVSSTPQLLRSAQRSGFHEVVMYAQHVASKCKAELAGATADRRRRRRLLLEALKHRRKEIAIVRLTLRPDHWNQGVALRRLGAILVDLAELETDTSRKGSLLSEAVRCTENGLRISTTVVHALDRAKNHFARAPLAERYRDYGNLLVRAHAISENTEDLRKAANAFGSAAGWYENTGLFLSQASCYWMAAKAYDTLHAYTIASEKFQIASKAYKAAGRAKSELREFYQDLALYLSACSKIATARQHHSQIQFDMADKQYREAASILRTTDRWNFLAPYFSACARLESAESFGRSGNGLEAIRLFVDASKLFGDSKVLLSNRLEFLDDPEEKSVTTRLVNAPTEEYCAARIILEEARIAENLGDYTTSSEKFGLAADKLGEVSKLSAPGDEAKEANFLCALSRAWQLSSRAESDQSDYSLRSACNLFENAKQLAPDEKAVILASAHVDFCKGLLAGRKFGRTFDLNFNNEATARLTRAVTQYLDAGFTVASEHATGRELSLEAVAEINRGNSSSNPMERAEHYGSAETLLRKSAEAFTRAQQPARRDQVFKILDMTRAQWELASEIAEIRRVASEPSTNLALHALSRSVEQALGPERFERTDIEARLVIEPNGSASVDVLELRLELLNVGKNTIQLLRIDDILPNGSKLAVPQTGLTTEGSSLVSDGRQIQSQSREAIQLFVRPSGYGLLSISPRVVFLDDKGLHHQKALQPVIVATSRIIRFLALEFANDYSKKRLAPIHCGWRSLTETSAALNIPRSHLYGEPRYGRLFGRQLASLLEASLVESRVFPGERGRGGDITKIRVSYDNDAVKRYVDDLTLAATIRRP